MHNAKSSEDTSKATPEEAKIKPLVFYGSVVGIVLFSLWAMFLPIRQAP